MSTLQRFTNDRIGSSRGSPNVSYSSFDLMSNASGSRNFLLPEQHCPHRLTKPWHYSASPRGYH